MSLNEEHHVGFVIEHSQIMVFVNGTLVVEQTLNALTKLHPDAYFTFGCSGDYRSFSSELRNVQFYNCAFGEEMMLHNMNCEEPEDYSRLYVSCDERQQCPRIDLQYYCDTYENYVLYEACKRRGHEHHLLWTDSPYSSFNKLTTTTNT